MRNLKKLLEKIYRKAALKLVKRGVEAPPKVVDAAPPEKQSHGALCVAAFPRSAPSLQLLKHVLMRPKLSVSCFLTHSCIPIPTLFVAYCSALDPCNDQMKIAQMTARQ